MYRQAYWTSVTGLWLLLASPAHANLPQAREEYRIGLALYDTRDYERALEQFRASYQDYPSPNSLLYVARCLRVIGNTEEAIAAYQRTVDVARVLADRDPKYVATLRAARWELAVLRPPPPPQQRLVPATWVAGTLSAAGLASFGVFWWLAHSKYESLENNCRPLPCSASQTNAVEDGRRYQLVANVSLAVGVAGAATAVSLYVLGRPRESAWVQVGVAGTSLQWTGQW